MPDVLAAGADAAAIITDVVRAPDLAAKVRALVSIVPRPRP
jgi:thiamine monophosphate synthase